MPAVPPLLRQIPWGEPSVTHVPLKPLNHNSEGHANPPTNPSVRKRPWLDKCPPFLPFLHEITGKNTIFVKVGIGKVAHLTVNFGHLRFKIFVSLPTTFCFNLILSHIQTQNYLHLFQLNVKLWFNFKSELMSLLCSI